MEDSFNGVVYENPVGRQTAEIPPDPVSRAIMRALERQRQLSLKGMSERLGLNSAYLQQFVTRLKPWNLHEQDRTKVAAWLKVDEATLRRPDKARPKSALRTEPPGIQLEGEDKNATRTGEAGPMRSAKEDLMQLCLDMPESLAPMAVGVLTAMMSGQPPKVDTPANPQKRGETS